MRCRPLSLFCVVILAFTSACSRGAKSPSPHTTTDSSSTKQKEAPVALEIKDSFLKDGELNVSALLEARTDIPSDEVAVFLRGLKDGKIISEQVQSGRDALGSVAIEGGKRILFRFAMPAEGLSEYQVACSWGDDARAMLSSRGSESRDSGNIDAPVGEGIRIAETPLIVNASNEQTQAHVEEPPPPVEIVSDDGSLLELNSMETVAETVACDVPPCDVFYTMTGELKNPTKFLASDIRLALGVTWSEKGADIVSPEPGADLQPSEELVELGDVALEPGQSQKIRLKIDRALPVLPTGRFIPHLRVVDYRRTRAS